MDPQNSTNQPPQTEPAFQNPQPEVQNVSQTPIQQPVPDETPLQAKLQRSKFEKIWRIFFILVVSIGFLVLINYLFINPHKISGELVEPFSNSYILAQRVTYWFKEPQVGDGVLFIKTSEQSSSDFKYAGIIIDMVDVESVKTYRIVSSPGIVRETSRDKIKLKTYYPQITPTHLENAGHLVDKAGGISPSPTPDPTADWETFSFEPIGHSFKYPVGWTASQCEKGIHLYTQPTTRLYTNCESPPLGVIFVSFNINPLESGYLKSSDFTLTNEEQVSLVFGQATKKTIKKINDAPGPENYIEASFKGLNNYYYVVSTENLEYDSILDQILSSFSFSDCSSIGGGWISEFNECSSETAPGLTAQWCSDHGGEFSGCESPCRHDPKFLSGELSCTQICTKVCKFN